MGVQRGPGQLQPAHSHWGVPGQLLSGLTRSQDLWPQELSCLPLSPQEENVRSQLHFPCLLAFDFTNVKEFKSAWEVIELKGAQNEAIE